jgi:hypothetical protein
MTYSASVLLSVIVVMVLDMWVFRTRLLAKTNFWLAYLIMVFFQLLTNAVLTGQEVVQYRGAVILGSGNDELEVIAFIGSGRFAYAPVEDLVFGFSFILLTLSAWVWLGTRGARRSNAVATKSFDPASSPTEPA